MAALPIAPKKHDDNIVRLVVSVQPIKDGVQDKLCFFDQVRKAEFLCLFLCGESASLISLCSDSSLFDLAELASSGSRPHS